MEWIALLGNGLLMLIMILVIIGCIVFLYTSIKDDCKILKRKIRIHKKRKYKGLRK